MILFHMSFLISKNSQKLQRNESFLLAMTIIKQNKIHIANFSTANILCPKAKQLS